MKERLRIARWLVRKWQRILRLQHWRVSISFSTPDEDDNLIGNAAYILAYPLDMSAKIVINDEANEPLELLVVHELLHALMKERMLVLRPIIKSDDADNIQRMVEERLVTQLTNAFVEVLKCG